MQPLCSLSDDGPASKKHRDTQEFMTITDRKRSNELSHDYTLPLRI